MTRLFLSTLLLLTILSQPSAAFQKGPDSTRQLYIVLLEQASLAEKVIEMTPDAGPSERRRLLESDWAARYQAELERNQERFIAARRNYRLRSQEGILRQDLEVLDRRTTLLNSMVVRGSEDQMNALRADPGVRGVYPNRRLHLLMDSAPELVGATVAWQGLGGEAMAGAGVRIGILDSGIDATHPMFQDGNLTPPAGFPKPDEFSQYTNSKVIVARTYVKTQFGLDPQDDQTPRDELGHGSRVAGVAAGTPTDAPLGRVRGIAPRAFLGNYRVFGTPGVNNTTTSAAVMAALNDALLDGMNVVNLSLGGPARSPENDPEQIAIRNLSQFGVVVVAAAGNSGPNAGTILSPGTSPDAITVGATSHSRVFGSAIVIASSRPVPDELQAILYIPGTGAPITQVSGPHAIVTITGQDASEEACSPLSPGSLTGRVALVRRGTCFFSEKAVHVLDGAGATGMVVYNNVEGPPIIMDFGETPPTKPAVMISGDQGLLLRDFIEQSGPAGGEGVTVTFRPEDEQIALSIPPDGLARFSARGPNIDRGIKPDLSATGTTIYTAQCSLPSSVPVVPGERLCSDLRRGPSDPPHFSNPSAINGTSFSTPMVSGGAALLFQAHPDWSVERIRSALVNTALNSVRVDGLPAGVNQGGNGRLDLGAALAVSAVLRPTTISFGLLNSNVPLVTSFEVTNVSGGVRNFAINGLQAQGAAPVTLSFEPAQFQLGPGNETQTVEVRADLPDEFAGAFEGRIKVEDLSGESILTLPFWGAVTVSAGSNVLSVASSQPGADFTNLFSALAEAQPGDTIEITDSSTYPGFTLNTNQDGLFLNGLTIRAGTGASPVIGADEGQPGINVVSLEGVTIEGLIIEGGSQGINFAGSSGVIRGNRIESEGETTEFAIRVEDGRAHIVDNVIVNLISQGVGILNSAALIQNNQIGLDTGGNGGSGIAASDSRLAVFDNTLIGNGVFQEGQAIRLSPASALIKGNTIRDSQGSAPHGVLIDSVGSRAHIQDNLIKNNAQLGIWARQGADVFLHRNLIRGNGLSGLRIDDGEASSDSDLFLANGNGIASEQSRLRVINSVFADSVSGPAISIDGGALELDFSSLHANAGGGVEMQGGSTGSIASSILFGNPSGDLLGSDTPTVRFTLFTDSPMSGTAGNFNGNPRFTDAANFDFSLQPDSDAIDRGEALAGPPFSDLFGHRRAIDGNGDGSALPDAGALEFASPEAPSIILPILATAAERFQGLALANAFAPARDPDQTAPQGHQGDATQVGVQGYRIDGTPFGPLFETSIESGSQVSFLLADELGQLENGWVEIRPSNPDLMSFTLSGTNQLDFLDGSQLAGATSTQLVLPEVRNTAQENTEIFVVNPHDSPLSVLVEWHQPGQTLQQTVALPARGSLSSGIQELFPNGPATQSAGTPSGYLTLSANSPLFAMELFGGQNTRAGLLALDGNGTVTDLYGAQLASTPQIETVINLINLGEETEVALTARNEQGVAVGTQVTVSLAAGEQWKRGAAAAFELESDLVGWLEIHSLGGSLVGNVAYGDPENRFLTALPLQARGAREFVLSHVAETDQIFTGLTILNATFEPALVSIEVFKRDAQGVERIGQALLDLEPGEKSARLLSQIVPNLPELRGGFIRVRSNVELFGFEIFGDQTLRYLSAVPQQVVVH